MELTSINTIKTLMHRHDVKFSKGLGQNFLVNPSVCPKMAEYGIKTDNTAVIEIGPGVGVLTKELAQKAKKVIAIELDRTLLPVLQETLADFNNIKIINADALKLDFNQLINDELQGFDIVVCANLPYYITSPIIMKLLEDNLPIKSITAMVQKEAGVRLCAPIPSREVGAITIATAFYAQRSILFNVSSGSFIPPPKVESCVIQLVLHEKPIVSLESNELFFKVVKAAFAQRRKTLTNSLSSGFALEKSVTIQLLTNNDIPPNYRAEQLSLEQFGLIANAINNL